jgi:hypothetical protein
MFEISAEKAIQLFGFKEGGTEYPCHYCGALTTLLDPETFHVCADHQREYGKVGFHEMQKKYPLAGKEDRNPEFFKAQREQSVARAQKLTPDELRIIVERGYYYQKKHAQALLDGNTLTENELDVLGHNVDEFLDN